MAIPMIDDIELKAVQGIWQETDAGFVPLRVPGLPGTVHQNVSRRSHRVLLRGVLLPDTAVDDLGKLQKKAAAGEEVTFTADITTALEIQKMVIEWFRAGQQVGQTGQTTYEIVLSENPPLPPPAEVSSFGGLDGFGLGDLGFDPGALGDVLGGIADQAGALMEAASAAMDAVQKLEGLANLAKLGAVGNPIQPVAEAAKNVTSAASGLKSVADAVKAITG